VNSRIQNPKRAELSDGFGAIIRSFELEPLNETTYKEFYYDGTMAIRTGFPEDSPVDDLFEKCTMPSIRNAHILSGHRGCGKSTELFNLKKRFEAEGHPVCLVSCEAETNLNLADCWDIMLLISEGLYRAILDENGEPKIKICDKQFKNMFDYILQRVEIYEEKVKGDAFDIGVAVNCIASVKGGLQMGSTQREVIRENIQRRGSEWKICAEQIADIITIETGGKQPILIFEDLDKLQPSKRAVEIFCYDTLAKMSFPIIYTFPIDQFYSTDIASIHGLYELRILPMIKVSNMERVENESGIEIIQAIVEKRADLDFFEDSILRMLIIETGGVLRHLFECIMTAARLANRRKDEKIGEEVARRALSNLANMLTKSFSMEENELLINIYNESNYRAQIENSTSVLRLMHGLVVLEYQNGGRWHDLHPQVANFLKARGLLND